MTEVEITNVASFIDATRRVCAGFGRIGYWFRGHGQAQWKLVPSVHRHYDSNGEQSLAARFRLAAPTRYAKSSELKDDASWLCLMQHFGLPTRLLDWTASPLAALYFAVAYEPMPGPGAVWVLTPSGLNKCSRHARDLTFILHGPEAQALVWAAFRHGQPDDDVLAVLGQDIDLRMTVQQGAFTIHGNDVPLEERPRAERYLAKFLIPERAKMTLDEELWVLGVRRSALFPDLANLAADLADDQRLVPRRQPRANT